MKALVIVVDGLGCGYLGCYGNEWIATPTLDRLAAEGVVFDQHFADQPDPAGARHAWRTGCYRFPLPATAPAATPPPEDRLRKLTERGVVTVLVADGARPLPPEWLAAWPQVIQTDSVNGAPAAALESALQRTGDVLDQLASQDDWLLWLDLATLLPPWELPAEYQQLYLHEDEDEENEAPEQDGEAAEGNDVQQTPWTGPLPERVDRDDSASFLRLGSTLAGLVTYLDAGLGLLLDDLEERGLLDDVALLITSGYGLAVGEHGAAGAAVPWLHEERTHVPLLLRLPSTAETGRRVFALTQSVDLMPTLFALFGVPPPVVHGQDLLPLCRGEVAAVRAYACFGLRTGDAIEWALRTPQWALVVPIFQGVEDIPRSLQLYVKPDDRWEVNNLYQHHPELTQHLEETLRGFVEATRHPGPLHAPPLRASEVETPEASPGNENT
jgi:arylsulfatase A-like enzyme